MVSVTKAVEEAGRRLGLSMAQDGEIAYGLKDGYLVELARGRGDSGESVVEIIRYVDPGHDQAVREAIRDSAAVASRGIKAANVEVGDGVVVYKSPEGLFRTVLADQVVDELDALLGTVKAVCGRAPVACRLCGSTSGSEPILLNRLIDRICPACIERLQHEAKRAGEQCEALPLNLPLAMLRAIAIGSGVLVGYGTTRRD
jgi:hypothetical protein